MSVKFLAFVVALCVVGIASAMPSDVAESNYVAFEDRAEELFKEFVAKHHKKYDSDAETARRLEIFRGNMKLADERNKLNGKPVHGVTKFADLSAEEFAVFLGRKGKGRFEGKSEEAARVTKRNPHFGGEKYNLMNAAERHASIKDSLPSLVDWTAAGAVTPVKNQGQCGSCWAFSTAETVESQWVMQGNSIWEFSPQQVASCVTDCYGCGGGDTIYAYEYLMGLPTTEGLGSAAFAPYIQSMYSACSRRGCTEDCDSIDVSALDTKSFYTGPYAAVSDYQAATDFCTGSCKTQNMTELAANLAVYGPASVCVNAANWNTYTGGVMTSDSCGGYAYSDLDHCVQLTGYNNQGSEPYWIVRNSWATNWGENGYIYLAYNDNTCGIADEATFVTISNDQADFE